jgi:hypothetical protein
MPEYYAACTMRGMNRDIDTGALLSIYCYAINDINDPLVVSINYGNILPDRLTFVADNDDDVLEGLREVINVTMMRSPEMSPTCPMCGSMLFTASDKLLCLNIGCGASTNNKANITNILSKLLPDVNIELFDWAFDIMISLNRTATVFGILSYLVINTINNTVNVDKVIRSALMEFLIHISNVSISNFLAACTVYDLSEDIDIMIAHYNNSFFKMALDTKSMYSGLANSGINPNLTMLISYIVSSNYELIDIIHPAIARE